MQVNFSLSTWHSNGIETVTHGLAMVRYVNGEEPYARLTQITGGPIPVEQLPSCAAVEHDIVIQQPSTRLHVIRGDSWTAALTYMDHRNQLHILVTARELETAEAVLATLADLVPRLDPTPDAVNAAFWHASDNGGERRQREIDCPGWSDIQANYPAATRDALASTMCLERPQGSGRLLLWHGEPGTGKTTAIRALAREWAPWTHTNYVMDPERFFDQPGYMLNVLLGDEGKPRRGEPDSPDWKLLIVEDADQFLTVDAKRTAGAGLGRLLNVTDGLVGQGLKVLVLITTNEPLGRLHPAVIRPGRCLAKIEFPRFAAAESREWLGADAGVAVPAGGATLAELYEHRGDSRRFVHELAETGSGLYL